MHTREDLKKYFSNGEIPNENHFCKLIDSMLNRQDDGFSKDDENGLIIVARGGSNKLVTLFKNMDDLNPFFHFEKDEQESGGLRMRPAGEGEEDPQDNNGYFFHDNGNMGIGIRCEEQYKLQVNGFAGLEGRVGTYLQGQVPADGKWHPIIEGLDNCQAYEVIARTGKKGFGKFAILHAHALKAFGKSHGRIRRTSAYYGSFWNRIRLRWRSNATHDYSLQVSTGRNYGHDVFVFYKITRLWDDEKFLSSEYYY